MCRGPHSDEQQINRTKFWGRAVHERVESGGVGDLEELREYTVDAAGP